MKSRRGISLAELLLTMSACTVVLTTSATLIHRALHTQSRTRSFGNSQRSAMRLADSFRRDVHAARSATIGDAAQDGSPLILLEMTGGQSVEYRQDGGRIERLHKAGGGVTAREAFGFPAGSQAKAEQPSPQLVRLSIVPPAEVPGPTAEPRSQFDAPLRMQVEARLARHGSLVVVPAAEEAAP
jgi:hypothetical protein